MQSTKWTFLLILLALIMIASCSTGPADIILMNGEVYTMEEDQPWASGIIIGGNRIKAVLTDDEQVEKYRGSNTRVIDLQGKFVVPGFIDGHVHFNSAGALINDANLMTVSDDAGLKKEM